MSNVRLVSREEVSNELIYYNLDVVNSSDVDFGSRSNPVVKFEETRTTPILTDASKYNFSIVRFAINGGNKDLPLFIPIVKPQQTGISITISAAAANNNFNFSAGGVGINRVIPSGTYTDLNALRAAIQTALDGFAGLVIDGTIYVNSGLASFTTNGQLNIAIDYSVVGGSFTAATLGGNAMTSGSLGFTAAQSSTSNTLANFTAPTALPALSNAYETIYSITIAGVYNVTNITPVTQFIKWFPETTDAQKPLLDANGNLRQSFADKYWWCYTYKHWVDCVNRAFVDAFAAVATQLGVSLVTLPPVMTYNESSGLFSISFDSNGFGDNRNTYLRSLASGIYTTTIESPINADQRLRFSSVNEDFSLFFNSNTFGLFSNFNNIYYGVESSTANNGMDNLIVVTNELTSQFNPYYIPPAAVPAGSIAIIAPRSTAEPTLYPRILFVQTQDYPSTSSLWSPIASIVFCSTLLPTLPENTQVPLKVGTGNNSDQNTSSNAFSPIITDIALPMGSGSDYRQFISYVPSAEYRLTSLGTSQVDIREINIQVFWKARLTGELIPLTLFNQSNVSLKILFRKRGGGV